MEIIARQSQISGKSAQSAIRPTRDSEPTDMKLTFSERKFKDLLPIVYFYPPLMYSF